jgi:hypothetical protein
VRAGGGGLAGEGEEGGWGGAEGPLLRTLLTCERGQGGRSSIALCVCCARVQTCACVRACARASRASRAQVAVDWQRIAASPGLSDKEVEARRTQQGPNQVRASATPLPLPSLV